MAIRKELNLRLPNSPGALGGVCRLLDAERVNIQALSLDASGNLRIVVDNHVHGAAVLRDHHHQVTERDVVVSTLPNTAGALAGPLRLVAEAGVNVEYAYGGCADASATASVVLGVDDAMRASAVAGL
jgi:hypothetical protein